MLDGNATARATPNSSSLVRAVHRSHGKIRGLDPMGMGFLDAREPPLIPQMPTFQGAGDGDCELPSQKVRTLHPMMITIHLWTL